MNWILLCPICSCVIDSFRALKNLQSHCRCTNCHVDLVAALDDMIAVTFTVSPAIRRIAYHDPETLSVEDYVFRYRSAEEGLVPDGTPFVRMKEMLNRGLAFIAPGEDGHDGGRRAEQGALRGSSVDVDAGFLFVVDPALPPAEQRIEIALRREFLRRRRAATSRPARSRLRSTSAADEALRIRDHRSCRPASTARRRFTSRPFSPASGCSPRRRSAISSAPR